MAVRTRDPTPFIEFSTISFDILLCETWHKIKGNKKKIILLERKVSWQIYNPIFEECLKNKQTAKYATNLLKKTTTQVIRVDAYYL